MNIVNAMPFDRELVRRERCRAQNEGPGQSIQELSLDEIELVSGSASAREISNGFSIAGVAISAGGFLVALGGATGPVSFGVGFGVAALGLFVSAAGYAASRV